MNNQFNLTKMSDLVGGHWDVKQIELIAEQVASEADPGELALFLKVAQSRGLDPFARQIHAVHRWDGRKQRKVMSIQVGIDGYRAIADRTGTYVGNEDPTFLEDASGKLVSATATVWRLVAGEPRRFTATARWDEYAARKKGGDLQPMWQRMPRLMLGKCAEALALRKAFPSDLSGLYTDAEMHQADQGEVVDTEWRPSAPAPSAPAPSAPCLETVADGLNAAVCMALDKLQGLSADKAAAARARFAETPNEAGPLEALLRKVNTTIASLQNTSPPNRGGSLPGEADSSAPGPGAVGETAGGGAPLPPPAEGASPVGAMSFPIEEPQAQQLPEPVRRGGVA